MWNSYIWQFNTHFNTISQSNLFGDFFFLLVFSSFTIISLFSNRFLFYIFKTYYFGFYISKQSWTGFSYIFSFRIVCELWIIYFSVWQLSRVTLFSILFQNEVRGRYSGRMLLFDFSCRKFGISNLKFHIVFHSAVI